MITREKTPQPAEKISLHDKEMLDSLFARWKEILKWLTTQIRPIHNQILEIQKQRTKLGEKDIEADQGLQRKLVKLQRDLKTVIDEFPAPTSSELTFENTRLFQDISTNYQGTVIDPNNLESMLLEKLFLTASINLTTREQKLPFQIDEWMQILSTMIVTLKPIKDRFQIAKFKIKYA